MGLLTGGGSDDSIKTGGTFAKTTLAITAVTRRIRIRLDACIEASPHGLMSGEPFYSLAFQSHY